MSDKRGPFPPDVIQRFLAVAACRGGPTFATDLEMAEFLKEERIYACGLAEILITHQKGRACSWQERLLGGRMLALFDGYRRVWTWDWSRRPQSGWQTFMAFDPPEPHSDALAIIECRHGSSSQRVLVFVDPNVPSFDPSQSSSELIIEVAAKELIRDGAAVLERIEKTVSEVMRDVLGEAAKVAV